MSKPRWVMDDIAAMVAIVTSTEDEDVNEWVCCRTWNMATWILGQCWWRWNDRPTKTVTAKSFICGLHESESELTAKVSWFRHSRQSSLTTKSRNPPEIHEFEKGWAKKAGQIIQRITPTKCAACACRGQNGGPIVTPSLSALNLAGGFPQMSATTMAKTKQIVTHKRPAAKTIASASLDSVNNSILRENCHSDWI